ncbi:MAG: 3-hydroxyacyl-CoA dehydrogenase [Actinomycetes bacterium]
MVDRRMAVGVVGAGTMGTGIAEVAARAGHQVRLLDAASSVVVAALDGLRQRLDRDVAKGRLTEAEADAVAGRVVGVGGVTDLGGVGLVVEAVREDLATKQSLFAELEGLVGEDCVLATNTSSLSVTAVAAGLRRPDRVVGLHFFNPAQRMRLVEVVRGVQTSATVVEQAESLARSWGKTPVTCTSTPWFIVYRVARPFYGEAQRLVEEGVADPLTVDTVLRDVGGFPLGPFELTDLVGQDVNLAVSRSVWEQTFHDPRYAPTVFQQRLVDAGRLGRKTGRGVYGYGGDDADGDPPPSAGAALPGDAPPAAAPSSVRYGGGWSVMAALLERAGTAGAQVVDVPDDDPVRADVRPDVGPEGLGVLLPSAGRLVETRGRPGLTLGSEVVVLDWALDPASTTRVVVAAAPTCSAETVSEACGLLQAAGTTVTLVRDGPGLVVARTVAMLVNEAADLVERREASAADVDTAMRLGTGYPEGPLAWGDSLGPDVVYDVLRGLAYAVPTGRYRVAPALERAARTAGRLHA